MFDFSNSEQKNALIKPNIKKPKPRLKKWFRAAPYIPNTTCIIPKRIAAAGTKKSKLMFDECIYYGNNIAG